MRYILFVLLVVSISFSSELKKQKFIAGAGPYIQSQPYKDVNPLVLPSPVFFYDNSLFYIRWTRFGVYFLGDKGDDLSWGFSLTAQPRTNGYSPDDSDHMYGMKEKENSWEGGISFAASLNDSYVEIIYLHDLLNKHSSHLAKVELGHSFKFDKISFYPSIVCIYQSADFLNYYYGVTQQESTNTIHQVYSPKSGLQYAAQSYINYPLTKDLAAFFNVRVDYLSAPAKDSPLTDKDYYYSGIASLIYTFEF